MYVLVPWHGSVNIILLPDVYIINKKTQLTWKECTHILREALSDKNRTYHSLIHRFSYYLKKLRHCTEKLFIKKVTPITDKHPLEEKFWIFWIKTVPHQSVSGESPCGDEGERLNFHSRVSFIHQEPRGKDGPWSLQLRAKSLHPYLTWYGCTSVIPCYFSATNKYYKTRLSA